MKKLARIIYILVLAASLLFAFQNCNKVQMNSVSDTAVDGNNGGLGTEEGGGTTPPTTSGGGTTNPPGTTPGSGGSTPPTQPDTDENWIALNCKEDELRKTPIALNFTATGGAAEYQQKRQENLTISNLKELSVQQVVVKNLNISKVENLQIQQVAAKNINIEALQISKIQSILVGEMKVRANRVGTAFQQIASYEIFKGPRLLLQSIEADVIQQVSALCVRAEKVEKIQQIGYAKVIGDGAQASVKDIQQLLVLKVVDADVEIIQQVGLVVLKNAHVKKIHQVGKLILINSTVDEMSGIGSIERP